MTLMGVLYVTVAALWGFNLGWLACWNVRRNRDARDFRDKQVEACKGISKTRILVGSGVRLSASSVWTLNESERYKVTIEDEMA